MSYLDYSRMPDHIRRHFSDLTEPGSVEAATVSRYGYFDIRRFFGPQAVDIGSLSLRHRSDSFQLSDPLIAQFAEEVAADMERDGLLRPGPPVMKLAAADWVAGRIEVCPVDFRLVAGTCLALDHSHPVFGGRGETLREYYKSKCPSTALEENPLAISLGVCGLLVVEEDSTPYLLKVRRSAGLITMAGTIGPSVAGNVDYNRQLRTVRDVVETQVTAEMHEELDLAENEYDIIPLAFAREIFRGERPQLFTLIRCHVRMSDLDDRLAQLCGGAAEFDRFGFVSVGSDMSDLNHEAGMNFRLMQEYVGAGGN